MSPPSDAHECSVVFEGMDAASGESGTPDTREQTLRVRLLGGLDMRWARRGSRWARRGSRRWTRRAPSRCWRTCWCIATRRSHVSASRSCSGQTRPRPRRRTNLRQVLHNLRRGLPDADRLAPSGMGRSRYCTARAALVEHGGGRPRGPGMCAHRRSARSRTITDGDHRTARAGERAACLENAEIPLDRAGIPGSACKARTCDPQLVELEAHSSTMRRRGIPGHDLGHAYEDRAGPRHATPQSRLRGQA
jgi:hypothetical protein